MKQAYCTTQFKPESRVLINLMNDIIAEYQAQGFTLTVRQLYYQLVARDVIANTEKSYKRVTGLVNDARMAGIMDWAAIEDRTRAFVRRSSWDSPAEIVRACVSSYHEDRWANQATRVFVIVEKEALVGVLEGTCHDLDVPLLAARGYPSASVLREFAVADVQSAINYGQRSVIIHLGDHDPSGIDMTRDLTDRIKLFAEVDDIDPDSVELIRIALTMDQIRAQRPPENPAKTTDARFEGYRKIYGASSWELDALSPSYLANLVRDNVENYIDPDRWEESGEQIEANKAKLRTMALSLEA